MNIVNNEKFAMILSMFIFKDKILRIGFAFI